MIAGVFASVLAGADVAGAAEPVGAPNGPLEAWNRLHLAQACSALRDFPNATRAFRQAHAVHRTYGNRRWQAIVLNDFGTMLTDAGHPTIGRAIRQQALTTLAEFA